MHLSAVLIAIACCSARADVFPATRAAEASTIAEFFIERHAVRVELEIGLDDADAFLNVMPDEIYERLKGKPSPLAERALLFTSEDLIISADGIPLLGRVTNIEIRPRIVRDLLTGEPIENREEELVLFVWAEYALDAQPATLEIRPPTRAIANIGFIANHLGQPVNEFRYLAQPETVDLDWDDPWHSRFRNRNLGRTYESPARAFIYVDAFEVRREFIVRPRDLQPFVDLQLTNRITPDDQVRIKHSIRTFFDGRCPILIDGKAIEPSRVTVEFVNQTRRATTAVAADATIDPISAIVGVIYTYPVAAMPDEVTLEWELFDDRIARVPATATDEAGPLPSYLTPDDATLRWANVLTNPSSAALVDVDAPQQSRTRIIPIPSLIIAAAAIAIGFSGVGRQRSRRWFAAAGAVLLVAVGVAALNRPTVLPLAGQPANAVAEALLANVYNAFYFRDESDIYDSLARSADGDLLHDLYTQTHRSLIAQGQNGIRVKVNDVTLVDLKQTDADDTVGFHAQCTWDVPGTVDHWGHRPARTIRNEADVTVDLRDDQWKLVSFEPTAQYRIK